MDKRGIYIPEDGQELAELFKEIADQGEQDLSNRINNLKAETEKEPPQKISVEDYLNSPERQRRAKIAHEASQRAAFERQMTFKQIQKDNPIVPRQRKKRGRKFRKRKKG